MAKGPLKCDMKILTHGENDTEISDSGQKEKGKNTPIPQKNAL
jgi:hypothetical protein